MIPTLEIGVGARLTARCMYPALAMAVVEVMAAITVAEPLELVTTIIVAPEVPRVAVRRMPARPSRMVLEPGRPRLRSEVPARRMPMIDDLRAVMQDDAEI